MNYTTEEYFEMYHQLSFARAYYLIFEEYAMKGIIPGFHHLGMGQEGVMVGIHMEKRPQDWYNSTHRTHPMSALDLGLKPWLGELFAKKNGFAGGMSGEAHMCDPNLHIGPISGLLGATPAMSAGIALAYKMDGRPGCVITGHGDGTTNEGVISEALNMVATWKLPVVWVIDNNGIALSADPKKTNAIADLSERAKGFGLPGSSYDASDVMLVREVMREAIQKAERGEPQLIEFRSCRWLGHFVGDPDLCRDPGIVKEAREKRDPLKNLREYLLGHNLFTAGELDAEDQKNDTEIRAAVEDVLTWPEKSPEDVLCSPLAEEY